MRYVFSLEATQSIESLDRIQEAKKEIAGLVEQLKPEAMYFSTLRRLIIVVANVEDPHVELRKFFEALSKWGTVTIDPVSTFQEFSAYLGTL